MDLPGALHLFSTGIHSARVSFTTKTTPVISCYLPELVPLLWPSHTPKAEMPVHLLSSPPKR